MKTKIICILDKSGSMASIKNDAIGGFNEFLHSQKKLDDIAYIDIILFSNRYDKIVSNIDVKEVELLNEYTYLPAGTTALYDAIGKTIDSELDSYAASPHNKCDKTLCIILTDGEENASSVYSRDKIKQMIEEMKSDFSWDFIFLAANQDAFVASGNMGISRGNTMNFSGDSTGVKMAYDNINRAAVYYRSSVDVNGVDLLNN